MERLAGRGRVTSYVHHTCAQCGLGFPGHPNGPKRRYCPSCRVDRRRAHWRAYWDRWPVERRRAHWRRMALLRRLKHGPGEQYRRHKRTVLRRAMAGSL